MLTNAKQAARLSSLANRCTSAQTTLTGTRDGGDCSSEELPPLTEALGRDPAAVAHEHAEKLTVWLVKRQRFLRAVALELPDGLRRTEAASDQLEMTMTGDYLLVAQLAKAERLVSKVSKSHC